MKDNALLCKDNALPSVGNSDSTENYRCMKEMVDNALFFFPLGGILFFGVIGFLIWERRQPSPQPDSLPSYRDMLPQLHKELSRARRLERPLSVVVIRLGASTKDPSSRTEDDLNGLNGSEFFESEFLLSGPIFGRAFREIDCATYDSTNRQYVIVLPETTKAQATQLVKRLNTILGEKLASRLVVGLSEFSSDGLCLEDLVAACGDDLSPCINYAPMSCPESFAQAMEKKAALILTTTERHRNADQETAKEPRRGIQADGCARHRGRAVGA